MDDALLGGGLWGLLTIVGPVLLGLVLLFAILRNRRTTRSEREHTERKTRELYKKLNEEDQAREAQP